MDNRKANPIKHQHSFNTDNKSVERRTFIVVIITLITMFIEILFGWLSNSMALFADGWHMGTHAFALGISLVAFILARKLKNNKRFSFGTWKIEIIGAYTSAVILGIVGLVLVYSSLERIINPYPIQYNQALLVAGIGLFVNLICAFILNSGRHSHEDSNHHRHHHQDDLNLKSVYLHVVADALTSFLAILALLGAKYFNLVWLDPFIGIIGAVLIIRWAIKLFKSTSLVLLDCEIDFSLTDDIKTKIESDGETEICDLHLWRVAQNKYACILSLITGKNKNIDDYGNKLKQFNELAHVTIEIKNRA